jgi:5-methylcytosine-specific restriction protein A
MHKQRASARERGYTARWERYRLHFLRANPLCVMCQREGRVVPATVVDHVIPARDRPDLFWQPDNHKPLCASHHSSAKQREERGHKAQDLGPDGWPADP